MFFEEGFGLISGSPGRQAIHNPVNPAARWHVLRLCMVAGLRWCGMIDRCEMRSQESVARYTLRYSEISRG
jgi:hypothetical protein